MALTWTQPSGYSLGTINERQTVSIALPVSSSVGITFQKITGKIPPGMRIQSSNLVGTPYEIPRTTEFKFVIRASSSSEFADRTFTLTVVGSDEPNWLTPAGALPIGANDAYYILDSSYIDFQLVATDTDTSTGQQLKFFIASDEGELPPGLILTESGRITGFVQPLLSIPLAAGNGPFDTDLYDNVAYDFGYRSTNGYDTYVFDLTVFDFSVPTGRPRKLNRNYEFIATVTDGDSVTKRKFRIFVVGDDFFRSDNVIETAGTGAYTADVSYVRAPIFTTPQYLGLRRANNYQTFKIDIYEGFSELGPVIYDYSDINALISAICIRETANDNRLGQSLVRIERADGVPQVGYKFSFNGEFTGATEEIYTITDVDVLGGDIYRLTVSPALEVTVANGSSVFIGTDSVLPTGMIFDQTTGEVFGTVPYQPAITLTYQFTIKAIRFGQGSEQAVSRRVFTVDILGEVESVMNWTSPEDLGTIDSGYVSTLSIVSSSTFSGSAILYTLEDGKLPPGLTLNLDGEIVGKVNQLTNQIRYRSLWKTSTSYQINTVVKQNNIRGIKSLTRRRNVATVVTSLDHNFVTGDLVEIVSDDLNFNYYDAVSVTIAPIELTGSTSSTSDDVYTYISGVSTAAAGTYTGVASIAVTGGGAGATFTVTKRSSLTGYNGVTTITMLSPGSGYSTGDQIKILGSLLGGASPTNDLTFIISESVKVTFTIPTQKLTPLAPVFTLIKGTSSSVSAFSYNDVPAASTTGSGTGARFKIDKGSNGSTNYTGLVTVILVDPGFGYLPGDRITISGAHLGGLDVVNDLTFTTSTGLEFWYRVNGNSNSKYNGRYFAVSYQRVLIGTELTDTLTLNFDEDPGSFGSGLISIETDPGVYAGQTLIVPLNYFNYPNKGASIGMKPASGTTYNLPTFYKCITAHTSSALFNTDLTKWSVYKFPESDKTLTTFDSVNLSLDSGDTTLDRSYTFTIRARDQLGYSAITRTFTLTVNTPNNTYYSNLTAKPFLKLNQRSVFRDFITDGEVFDQSVIYRPSDPYFGIQTDLKMLVYAGIETKQAVEYISAMGRNHKTKRFTFGELKKAVAKIPGTNTIVYEIIYVEMLDPLEKGKDHLPSTIKYSRSNIDITVDQNNEFYIGPDFSKDTAFWHRPIPFNVTLDRNDVFAGDPGTGIRFPSSISLWRYRIQNMENTASERNYLPLWMRSIQPGETTEINYVAAVPLCYCKPGGADTVLLNIENYIKTTTFDFKNLDYTIDRYTIDSVTGEYTDKYLVFRNDRTTIT